jgi:UDP-N-acetylmuramate dehydrogenase
VHTFPAGARRVSASWLLENSGYVLGQPVAEGVRLSKRQFTLVAGPGATTAGFVEATRRVQERVLRRTGVRLQPELDAVGRLPRYDRLLDFSRLDVAVSSR